MSDAKQQKNTTRMEWLALLTPERMGKSAEMLPDQLESAFEQDYRQIISSASFRRLQDKTQVFPLDRSDFVRTRLTHSLEVSALARALGQRVAQRLYFYGLAPELSLPRVHELCDILVCAGLIHDIGNPPFGHYGETTIRDWFRLHLPALRYGGRQLKEVLTPRMCADFYQFEGNAQALRVVGKLHFLSEDRGMNLTLASMAATIKYPVSSLDIERLSPDIGRHKMGYFLDDEALFTVISRRTGTLGRRHPLALILEAADDIAYRTADIEDAQRKGRCSYGQLMEALRENPRVSRAAPEQRARYEAQLAQLVSLREEARRRRLSKPEQFALQNWVVSLRDEMLQTCAQAFADHYDTIMTGNYPRELAHGTSAGLMLEVLGDVAYDFVFSSKQIVQMEISANTIIGGLLDKFVPACLVWESEWPQTSLEPRLMAIISDNYKACYHRCAEGRDEVYKLYLRLLLITDYLSGMTDSFAKSLYQQMNGL